jgi:uncharacterized protein
MPPVIVPFKQVVASEETTPGPERLIAGTPKQTIANHFTDPTQQFFAGRWSSTRGKWRVRYTESELCHLTVGRVRIESTDGAIETFGPGDTFVVPSGFEGTWEVLEDCSKIYAIFEPAQR